jgi:antitoxin CptB
MARFLSDAVAAQALLLIRAPMSEELVHIRKRLAWRASRRGIKEMDIVVGGFADARLSSMSPQELVVFEAILDIPDQFLLSWLTGQEDIPQNMQTPLLLELLAFRPGLAMS